MGICIDNIVLHSNIRLGYCKDGIADILPVFNCIHNLNKILNLKIAQNYKR